MALFKTRKGSDEPQAPHRQPQSVEAIRTRARHRLIGAGVLVLVAIIGFPVLFDTQPRPVAVDIPIRIPDRNKVKPLAAPAPSAVRPASAGGPVSSAPAPVKMAAAPAPNAQAAPEPKSESRPEAGSEPRSEPKSEARPESSVAAAVAGRYVVQIGAFADAAKAREARMKLERAGLKTYTQVAQTHEGKRTRVRVGPFGTRAEAGKAADKIKGLDLPAAILSL